MLRRGLLLLALAAVSAGAQQRFTTQVLLVPAFAGPERGLSSRASDIVRSRIAGAFPRSELRVVSGGDLSDWLEKSGFDENAVLSEGELKDAARKFRVDERVTDRFACDSTGFRAAGPGRGARSADRSPDQ